MAVKSWDGVTGYKSRGLSAFQLGRMETFDAALNLATLGIDHIIIPIDSDTVLFARDLAGRLSALTAGALLYLTVCKTKKIEELKIV